MKPFIFPVFAPTGRLPSGVILTKGNKVLFAQSRDGLLISTEDSTTQTNAAGAYNGGGVGQKAFVQFDNYDGLPFASLTALEFNARTIRDANSQPVWGNVYWNMLANFNSGALASANDYVNLVIDGGPFSLGLNYFQLTASAADYVVDLVSGRSVKVVGGTGSITMTGNCTSGSPIITNLSNVNALTVGMFLRVSFNGAPGSDATPIPDGSVILSINVGANSCTISNNATATLTSQSLRQYGGIAPVSRVGVVDGSTAIITEITNTADLQVNMLVSGVGIPANSYIISMIANTSITLNQATTIAGTPTLSFIAAGKTGIPSNAEHVGATWAQVIANNPHGTFTNTTPTIAGGWAAADGGWPKNAKMSGINFIQGGSGTTDARINALRSVVINSDVYNFAW